MSRQICAIPAPSSEPPRPDRGFRINPFTPSRRVRVLCGVGFGFIAFYLALIGGSRINFGWPDFEYFYKSGYWLLHHGDLDPGWDRMPGGQTIERGKLDWYWPFVPRMMTLFAAFPYKVAGYTWLLLNLVAMFATLRLLARHLIGLPAQNWTVTLLPPMLVLLVFWYWEFRLNQIGNFTLFMLVLSFVLWQQGRTAWAGVPLGLAVLMKVTPGLVVVWFALKREFRTVGVAVATVLLLGPLSDVIIFGPERARDIYIGWVNAAAKDGSHRGLIMAQREMDWRNQAIGAVLSRWLHPTNYNMKFDNEPRAPRGYEPLYHNVANLPRETIAGLATGIVAISGLALVWLGRRRAAAMSPWELRLEWSLFVLAMLWFMPVMRLYHMIWALPAVALLGAMPWHLQRPRGWTVLMLLCIAGVIAGQVVLPWRLLKSTGVTLAAVLLIAIPIIALLLRLARRPGDARSDCATVLAAAPANAARVPATQLPVPAHA